MRKLAILLLISSPLLTVIGMAGCVASVASIGNTSRQMTPLEVFGLLGAPFLFVAGTVLLIVDWRRRRRAREADGLHGARSAGTAHPLSGFANATVSVGRIVTMSALVATGFGLFGLALNLLFLILTADGWLTVVESSAMARYIVIPLACLLGCLPVGYAVLAWRLSFRRRVGVALRPHEDAIMKAMESIVIDYVTSRTKGSPHANVLTAGIRRVASLPRPVREILARVAHRIELSSVLDKAMGAEHLAGNDCQVLVPVAVAGIRRRLDEALFAPRKNRLLYLFLSNLCLFGLMMGVTAGLAEFTGAVIGGLFLVAVILLSNHPVAKDIRGILTVPIRFVVTVVGLIGLSVTGILLISRKRSQIVRWVGYAVVEIIYALLVVFACLVLCAKFNGEQSHIIVPVAGVAFLVPSAVLLWWIRTTRIPPSPPTDSDV